MIITIFCPELGAYMQLSETVPIANMKRSLPTTLAAWAHRAEGQCLLEGQAQNSENSRRLLGGT
jgi:hypothetical protein